MWLLLLVVGVFSWAIYKKWSKTGDNLPPGYRGLPFIGSPWLLLRDFHDTFSEMAKKWGDITSLKIFGQHIIALNSTDVIREAFTGQKRWETFSGRPIDAPLQIDNLLHSTTGMQPTERWVKQRRLVHKILSLYGEGLEGTESSIHQELTEVLSILKERGLSIDISEVLYPSLINIITILLKGHRYEFGDPQLKNIELMDEWFIQGSTLKNTLLLSLFPFLRYFPIGPGKYSIWVRKSTKQFFKDYFDETKATYDPLVTRGMIDFLFHHQRETTQPDGTIWLEDKFIKSIIQEMIGAGSVTTRGALYSFFLIIALKPEVAKKIQREIDHVIGSGRFAKLDDRSNMPYTMCCMYELLRYISHVPTGLPHRVLEDAQLHGYTIPRNSTIMANLWLIHHDPNQWTDPWEFKPERFLDSHGRLFPADHPIRKSLMPFGIGRRSCVGETFAKSRMFLFITTLLQRFDFKVDLARSPTVSCDPRTFRTGLVLSPQQYYLNLTPRT